MRVRDRAVLLRQSELPEKEMSYLDDLDEEPVRGSIQVYFQNLNTPKLGIEIKEETELFKRLTTSGVSLISLSEVNKNMELEEAKTDIEEVVKKGVPLANFCGGGNKIFQKDS